MLTDCRTKRLQSLKVLECLGLLDDETRKTEMGETFDRCEQGIVCIAAVTYSGSILKKRTLHYVACHASNATYATH